MKNNSKFKILNQILFITALGLASVATTFFFSWPLKAQTVAEVESRPAITTENDRLLLNSLIKSSLVALNQANLTNNYSVLRELSSPAFQDNNTNEDLRSIFAGIREANLDFAAIVEYEAVFETEPTLDSQSNLYVKGYFPTSPRIEFEFLYQLIDSKFLIDVFSVSITPNNENP